MSPALAHPEPASPVLTAQRGGLALPLPKMHPSEIPLTLSADVLRLPLLPATRLVLAEIVSLYAATGHCDASDNHFAARLTVSTDTVSRAVKELEAAGLVVKVVTRVAIGQYRTLSPVPEAIEAKAASNPYPQNAGCSPQNAGRPTRKMPETYPQNAGSSDRKMRVDLPAKCGSNTPSNIPENFQVNPDDAACAAAPRVEKKIGPAEISHLALAADPADAAHTEGGAADVATLIPWLAEAEPTKRPVLLRDSPLADFARFAQAWAALAAKHPDTYAPYAQADLAHYHAALLDWSNANGKAKHDWLATIRGSMRRDADSNRLRLAGTSHSLPTATDATTSRPHALAPRPLNGHKPDLNAGRLSRALAERGRQ